LGGEGRNSSEIGEKKESTQRVWPFGVAEFRKGRPGRKLRKHDEERAATCATNPKEKKKSKKGRRKITV